MNKINFLTGAVVLLVLLNGATLFYLYRQRNTEKNAHPPGGGPAAYIIEQLKLNPQQQIQFEQLRNVHQAAIRPAREADKQLHQQLFALVKEGKNLGAQTDSLMNKMAEQRRIMETATFTHFQQLRALCTDEQKSRLNDIIDQLAAQLGRQQGPPPGRPPHERDIPGAPPHNGHPPPPGE